MMRSILPPEEKQSPSRRKKFFLGREKKTARTTETDEWNKYLH